MFGGSAAPDRLLTCVPELLSLPLLVVCTVQIAARDQQDRRVWAVLGLLCGLILTQLIPVPPPVWTHLPGRAAVASIYAAAGEPLPWLPVSLTPGATERFLFGLLPAAALLLAFGSLDAAARRRIVLVAVGAGLMNAALGLVQWSGGPGSALRFYASASRQDAVGFFANRNHYAAFLYMLIPLAAVTVAGSKASWRTGAACVLTVLPLLAGIMMSGSRAGWALGFLAVAGSAWIVGGALPPRPGPIRKLAPLLALAASAGFLLAMVIAAVVLLPRLQSDSLASDLRWQINATTWTAIKAYFPAGSGFGSFQQVYAIVEKPGDVMAAMVNNAHDDWLEIILEAGLPGAVLLGAALVTLIRQTAKSLRMRGGPADKIRMDRATLLVFWLCALHSCVEYPLRTMAVNVILAVAIGLRTRAAQASALEQHVHVKTKQRFVPEASRGRHHGLAR